MTTTPQPDKFHCPRCDYQFMTAFAMEVHLGYCRVEKVEPAQGHTPTMNTRRIPSGEWVSTLRNGEYVFAQTFGETKDEAEELASRVNSHAALVASRDALAEALQANLQVIKDYVEWHNDRWPDDLEDCKLHRTNLEKARAALAKAQG